MRFDTHRNAADLINLFNHNDIFTDPAALSPENRGMLYEGCLALGRRIHPEDPKLFMYDFIRQLPGDDAGAFHSSELWYVFNTMDKCWRPWTEQDLKLAKTIHNAWVQFISTGNPGWKSFPYIQVFDVSE